MAQPSVLSKVGHQWVYNNKRESIFFVQVRVKLNCRGQVRQFFIDRGVSEEEADRLLADNHCNGSTGFLVAQHGNSAYIATCCHLLQDFYSNESVLLEEHTGWFNFNVLCVHNEEETAYDNPALYDTPADPRLYSVALVVKVDSRKDLMLLQVRMDHLFANASRDVCTEPHPPLMLAENVSPQLEDVVMISWPPLLCNTVVSGEVMHQSRRPLQISTYDKGYTMDLVECNIIGHDGCSGSPVLDHEGEVIGLYHGRVHGKGYSVSLADIRDFFYN